MLTCVYRLRRRCVALGFSRFVFSVSRGLSQQSAYPGRPCRAWRACPGQAGRRTIEPGAIRELGASEACLFSRVSRLIGRAAIRGACFSFSALGHGGRLIVASSPAERRPSGARKGGAPRVVRRAAGRCLGSAWNNFLMTFAADDFQSLCGPASAFLPSPIP